MKFYKTVKENGIIFTIKNKIIDDFLCDSIVSEIFADEKTGIDMRHVYKIEGKNFIKYLLENRYKLFNIQNEILTYLSLTLKDGDLKTYMSEEDFFENKRGLIRRRFRVV